MSKASSTITDFKPAYISHAKRMLIVSEHVVYENHAIVLHAQQFLLLGPAERYQLSTAPLRAS